MLKYGTVSESLSTDPVYMEYLFSSSGIQYFNLDCWRKWEQTQSHLIQNFPLHCCQAVSVHDLHSVKVVVPQTERPLNPICRSTQVQLSSADCPCSWCGHLALQSLGEPRDSDHYPTWPALSRVFLTLHSQSRKPETPLSTPTPPCPC